MTWDVEPERVRMPESWPQAFTPYLRNVDDLAASAEFRDVLREVGAGKPSPADALFASMDWIDGTIYAEADGEALPDPDPANVEQREFAWMTVHEYKPDRPVTYPFKDIESLKTVR